MHRIDIQLFCVFVFQSSVYETDSIHSAWRWRIYQAFSRWTQTQWTLNSSVGAVANPSIGYFQREGTRTGEAGRSVRRNGSQSGGCTRRITTERPNGWVLRKSSNRFRGRNPLVTFPRIPGHGVLATVIEGDSSLPAGTDVALSPYTSCGSCASCRRGRSNACKFNQTLGVQRDGALAEIPSRCLERSCYPAKLTRKELCLVEPLTVGFHAVARGRIKADDTVAILGCGGVGLGAVSLLRTHAALARFVLIWMMRSSAWRERRVVLMRSTPRRNRYTIACKN